jgi:hypothetical protein
LSIVAITLIAFLKRAILSRASILKPVALTILPGRKATAIIAALAVGLVRRPVGKRLRGVGRGARLGLKALLRLLVSDLPLRGRGETIGQRVKVAVIVHSLIVLSGRPLLTALRQRLGSVGSGNKSEIMLSVLQIIFRRHRISARMSVSCELQVFFSNVMRVAAYFDVGSVRFIGSRQRIGPTPIVRRSAAHPLILTWSHFDFPIFIRLAHSFSDRFRFKLSRFFV